VIRRVHAFITRKTMSHAVVATATTVAVTTTGPLRCLSIIESRSLALCVI
jgi:hypothetical protein